jgi:hypothetical protein
MSNYSNDKFSDGGSSNEGTSDLSYQLKLSVDILTVKNFVMSANIITKYNLNLQAAGSKTNPSLVYHSFAAKEATPVS